jgi:hypothetical protein
MTHILFLPGTFGSTIDYVVRTFAINCPELTIEPESYITSDGSMHSTTKLGHWTGKSDFEKYFNGEIDHDIEVSTPTYPTFDLHAKDIIDLFKNNRPNDKYIFIYIKDINDAELNMLMQYYKIAKGVIQFGIKIFCGKNEQNIINWNSNYTHWSEMQAWELREWLSLFYPGWVSEWIEAKQYVPETWLQISSDEILNNTISTVEKIFDYYKKLDTSKRKQLENFLKVWRQKQQYIIDEYNLVENIITNTIDNKDFSWEPVNIITESIVQQKLRSRGFEIKCYNLNIFPTNSKILHNLLTKQ